MAKAASEFHGILIVDKPAGFTSHDVVAKLRGMFRTRRIGHGGTLDPMATGVLPVFIGGATKAADFAAAQDKAYFAGFTLGCSTDTQDTTGTVVETSGRRASAKEVEAALRQFEGRQLQLPPMYSAVQVNGKRLYELARKGIEAERPERAIELSHLLLADFDEEGQKGHFHVTCSKGTYVRTVVHDLGVRLGTLAAMHSLVRTRSGRYPLEEALPLDAIQQAADEGRLAELLRPTDSLFEAYPAVTLDDAGWKRAQNGAFIDFAHAEGCPQTRGAVCRVYYGGEFRLLGRVAALDRGGLALFVQKNFR